MCADTGTDFVKTSTGFADSVGSSISCPIIEAKYPPNVGIKASGGIKDLETAQKMIDAGADRLGVSVGVSIMKELK